MEFDLVIIGSGPGGYTSAIRAGQLGLKTCIIEKYNTLGGTCLNVGCIPSKALLDSSEHFYFAREESKNHGILIQKMQLDLPSMVNRKDKIVKQLTQGVEFLMKKNKVTKIHGTACITGPNTVKIDGKKEISAKNILIATGSKPRALPFAPFNKKNIFSSTEALTINKLPTKMVVIGGGVIGLELGSVWARLGTEVTVIENSDRLCSFLDKDMSTALLKALKKQGLNFIFNAQVTALEDKKGQAVVAIKVDGKEEKISSDVALVSIGRIPYHEGLGLEDVNVKKDKQGFIIINSNFQTSVPSIYALGDVIGGSMLAHKAEEEGVAVAEIISTGKAHVNYKTLPSVIYTWPEVASVGLTEELAKKEHGEIKIGRFPFAANGRAKALGCTDGFVKIIASKKTDEILGVHILGPRASDMLAEAVVAMEFSATSEDIAKSFHAHPTLSEVMREAALDVQSKARQM